MIEGLVSVVMPSFNSEDFIDESISSVLNQSWKSLELIVVDDCSSDGTCQIVSKRAAEDSRVRLIKNEVNRGAAVTRNIAIEAAMGQYIAFLDSDDLWAVDKLKRQLGEMRSNRAALSCTGYEMVRADGRRSAVVPPRRITRRNLLSGCDIGCLTAVIDLSMIDSKIYMRNIRKRQDYLLWIDIIAAGGPAFGMPDVLATLNLRSGSLSSNKISAAKYQWSAYRNELNLNFPISLYYFLRYAFHGVMKHRF